MDSSHSTHPTLRFEDWDRDPRYLKLRRSITRAIASYQLIEAHDKIMVGVSGGKDSAVLYAALLDIKQRSPYPFTVYPVILDQKQPGFALEAFRGWIESLGHPLQVIEQDTYAIVKEKTAPGKSYCGLCSRLRRGILYNYAIAHGFTKIALGHHRDDINITLLLNAFYNGSLSSMPPKLRSQDGKNTVIRPLVFVPEKDTRYLADAWKIPLIPCNLCGSQDNLRRQELKKWLVQMEKRDPQLGESLLAAQSNIKPAFMPGPVTDEASTIACATT